MMYIETKFLAGIVTLIWVSSFNIFRQCSCRQTAQCSSQQWGCRVCWPAGAWISGSGVDLVLTLYQARPGHFVYKSRGKDRGEILHIFCMANSPPRLGEYAYAAWAGQGGLAVSQVITAETRDGHLKLWSDANDASVLATGCTSKM